MRMRNRVGYVALFLAVTLSAASCGGGSGGDGDGDGVGDGDAGDGDGDTSGDGDAPGDGDLAGDGDGDGAPVTGEPVALEDYATALAAAICSGILPCCGELGLELSLVQCEATAQQLVRRQYEGARPDNYTYDAQAAGVCVAHAQELFDEQSCADYDTSFELVCDDVFSGELAPGESCDAEVECETDPGDDNECETLDDAVGDVCVVRRSATEGEECTWNCREDELTGVRVCAGSGSERGVVQGRCFSNDGLYCSEGGTCVAQGSLTDSCAGPYSCGEGYCDGGTDQCTEPALENEPCTTNSGCAEGLYCADDVCAADLAPGSTCTLADGCAGGSCVDGQCVENEVPPEFEGLGLFCRVLQAELPVE